VLEQQLRLFAPARPLVDKLGAPFFRALPQCPGVYLMFGAREELLYVGKAKNLRARLNSYRYVTADRSARKTLRLVHAVERICWENCDSEQAALLRENALLRLHRPRFNRTNTYPRAYLFIRVNITSTGLQLALSDTPCADSFGAFKGRVRRAFAALARLLYSHVRNISYDHLPHHLSLERSPRNLDLTLSGDTRQIASSVRAFMTGEDDNQLLARLTEAECAAGFYQHFRSADLDELKMFFTVGPRRNRLLREHQGAGNVIEQEWLDDFLALHSTSTAKVA
jgi:excinuclease UvrABC nuclease subunit